MLATYSTFTALQQPQTITDAAGQATTVTYNASGQVLTTTNARQETTSYSYDSSGRLLTTTGPVSGAVTTNTYDAYGRTRTVTDADNFTVTFDYDVFGRPTRTTYPNGTYEETTYDRLDVATRRDRAGRITRSYYDALRRLTATRDAAGRVVTQEWCGCGALDALIDANGNRTRWERDLQGRVTREVRADGVTATLYSYESKSGRLATVTDPKQQVTSYTYARDNALLSTVYTNAVIATPSVSFTYDPTYGRVATMTDGIGLSGYAYHPAGQLGAGQIASVDGPLTDDTMTYSYDELGRVTTRAINAAANTVTWSFDQLGRVTSEVNLLGTFSYSYDATSSRVATVTYPNNQTSTYAYFDNQTDRRLQTIHHKYPNGSTLSKFDYTYDAVGNIVTWRQQADTSAVLWDYGYDAADQLVAAVKRATDPQASVLQRFAYAYDPAGNRTVEQIDDRVTGATYDVLNRLVSQQPSGVLQVAGTLGEPATVTVQGQPATTSGTDFRAAVAIASGANTLTLTASDPSGNTATRQYEVDSSGATKTFTFDANGNLTTDGIRTFEWDAKNNLVAVNTGSRRAEFVYQGDDRRARVIEKQDGLVQQELQFVACNEQLCEARTATETVRYFRNGEQRSNHRFFTTDHLGSAREVTNSTGAVAARYQYGPWGEQTGTGAQELAQRYTGHFFHPHSGVLLSPFRAYDAATARWFSEDPIRTRVRLVSSALKLPEGAGDAAAPLLSLFTYADNRPIRFVDSLGLKPAEHDKDCSDKDPRCDGYRKCDEYRGANAVCFCRCAGNSKWSQVVRCCLFLTYQSGAIGNDKAHLLCYAAGTAATGVTGIPFFTLQQCYDFCTDWQQENCCGK